MTLDGCVPCRHSSNTRRVHPFEEHRRASVLVPVSAGITIEEAGVPTATRAREPEAASAVQMRVLAVYRLNGTDEGIDDGKRA